MFAVKVGKFFCLGLGALVGYKAIGAWQTYRPAGYILGTIAIVMIAVTLTIAKPRTR